MINLPTHDAQLRIAFALEAIASAQGKEIAQDWTKIVALVRKGYGKQLFPVGTQIPIVNGQNAILFDVVDHRGIDDDGRLCERSEAEAGRATPGMILQTHYAVESVVFDPKQAFFATDSGLRAGTYNFKYSGAYYQFTLPVDLPAGGQLTHDGGFCDTGFTLDGKTAHIFAGPSESTELANCTITAGNAGVYLGEYYSTSASAPGSSSFNHIHRGSYGSNHYGESAIREWLSSADDRFVPSYYSRFMRSHPKHGTAGFLLQLPESFTSCIRPIVTKNWTNNYFELGHALGAQYELTEKFWLPSRYEVFGTYDRIEDNAKRFEFFVGSTDADRIKLNKAGGSAQTWWMRSPYSSYAYSVRYTNTSGALNNYYAYSGLGVAPACVIA